MSPAGRSDCRRNRVRPKEAVSGIPRGGVLLVTWFAFAAGWTLRRPFRWREYISLPRMVAIVTAIITTTAACSSNNNSTPTTPAPTVTQVAVTGAAPNVGLTAAFVATATFSNGVTQTVTSQATWQSSNTAIATVNSAGIVSGVGPGDVDITATYQSVAGRSRITIAVRTFTLSGNVTDGTSGGILPNINLAITSGPHTGVSTKTDASGAYTLTGLEAGAITVTASAVSYYSQDKALTLIADARLDFVMVRSPDCAFTLSVTSQNVPAAGGTFNVIATSPVACPWTASTSTPWIALGATSGNGSAAISWTASANTTIATRTGAIRVSWNGGFADLTVTQSGTTCSFVLNPEGGSFPAAGGTGSFTVMPSDPGCPWTTASDSSWLTISSGQSGTGPGTVAYSVGSYAGPTGPRVGTIAVSGGGGFRGFAVQQQPPP